MSNSNSNAKLARLEAESEIATKRATKLVKKLAKELAKEQDDLQYKLNSVNKQQKHIENTMASQFNINVTNELAELDELAESAESAESTTTSTCMQNHCNNPVVEDEIICSNCYSLLGGGSKKELTTKQQKQLKKIMLLYNKIRTKLLNNN